MSCGRRIAIPCARSLRFWLLLPRLQHLRSRPSPTLCCPVDERSPSSDGRGEQGNVQQLSWPGLTRQSMAFTRRWFSAVELWMAGAFSGSRSRTVPVALMGDCAAAQERDPRVRPEGDGRKREGNGTRREGDGRRGEGDGRRGEGDGRRGEGDGRRRNLGVTALGWLVAALALAFLGHELWRSSPWALAGARAPELALAVAVGTLAYGLAGFLLADAWRHLLGPGSAAMDPWRHWALYGRAQIAKYLPGNFFHFVGRQVLGRRLGHPHGALALASLGETVSLLVVTAVLALPVVWPRIERILGMPAVWLVPATAGVVVVLVCLNRRRVREWRARGALCGRGAWAPHVLRAVLLHAAFFVVAGLVLWGVAAAIRSPTEAGLGATTAIATMAMAWWIGFVAPGVSAGVGVREAVLVLALEPSLGSDGAMLVALTLRLIMTCGDLLFFVLCAVTGGRGPAEQEAGDANPAPAPPLLK
jgi:glycosyltransferase 2 family protein